MPSSKKFMEHQTPDSVADWFSQLGYTDTNYLRAHFLRYDKTKAFALGDKPMAPLTILDIGAHWLHNAFFYANDGHMVHCVDSPVTMRDSSVIRTAEMMEASLHIAQHLEFGDGISDISESSVDLVLFCEILEHLAFNPILLWKQVYRVLKPGGRIIVTTPNANHWPRLRDNLDRLAKGEGWGPSISEIMTVGTFGHHWKEYTTNEVKAYFQALSNDFRITRCTHEDIGSTQPMPRDLPFTTSSDMLHDTILCEVLLDAKNEGIKISPPWLPQYS
jgi:SAM-dependent methyltransferase